MLLVQIFIFIWVLFKLCVKKNNVANIYGGGGG